MRELGSDDSPISSWQFALVRVCLGGALGLYFLCALLRLPDATSATGASRLLPGWDLQIPLPGLPASAGWVAVQLCGCALSLRQTNGCSEPFKQNELTRVAQT